MNTYVFYRSKQALPKSKMTRTVFYAVYFFFYSAFIIAMLGRNLFPLVIQKVLYFPGTVWMGMLLYLLIFFFLTDIIYFFNRFFHYLPATVTSRYRKIQVLSGYILVLYLSVYGYYQYRNPQVVEQKISIAKKAGAYKSLKVVGVSDFHLGVANDKNSLERYVELINEQHPDLILIAGDLIDNNTLPLEKERMWENLNELQAPLGVYFCMGNHEYMSGSSKEVRNFFSKTNIHILKDSLTVINNSIQIVGRDDRQGNRRRKPLKDLVKNADSALPLFLIDHEPFHLYEAEENGIDLQFSGHTHHGQIFPANILTDLAYELSYGYMQKGNTHYFVSSGLGLWGPPFRIGTHSEVVVFNIVFN